MGLPQASVNILILWAVLGCFLGILSVGLRFYARRLQNAALAVNDYAAGVALVYGFGPP